MKQPRSKSAETFALILQAAQALIERQGASSLTIDAVALEAGLSKGGVLHHFRSKDALIAAMVDRKVLDMRAELAEIAAGLARDDPRVIGMVRHGRAHYACEDGFPRALLIAAAAYPEALGGFRDLLTQTLAESGGDRDPQASAVFIFATLGLLLAKTLGFSTLDATAAARIFDRIEGLARVSQAQDSD